MPYVEMVTSAGKTVPGTKYYTQESDRECILDIYGNGIFPQYEKQFEAIEAALGFRLFAWQKAYIVSGKFRQYGATTAEILRELMQVEAFPLDYTKRPTTQREAWYRDFLREIKRQLDDAGVPTREVFFNQQQKRAYMDNPENRERERQRYQGEGAIPTRRLWNV